MTGAEFNHNLELLGLKQSDAAALLQVTPRAVRRWQSGEQQVPGTVAELVMIWRQLHAANIPWGADLESIWYGDDDQIRRHQDHDKALAAVLRRVKARGGFAAPWRVNLKEHSATLGQMVVRFYKLSSGSFSLQNYRRGDRERDPYRDQLLIEEAIAAFSAAIGKAKSERPEPEWDE
ncbi:MAG: hypothetical protein ACLQFI_04455 [Methylocella sp.]